jgi:hypothetical protein
MSKLTNFAENALVDFIRGQTLTLPASWYFALGNTADDTGFTEVTGTSYARVAVTRSLTNFSGTQGATTTTASTGTSHETRNNAAVTWPTAGAGGWTAATKIGVFDASSGGNCWFYGDLGSSVTVASGNAHVQAISTLVFTLGLTGGMSDYLANKLIDLIWRAQSFTWPANTYVRLVTTTPTNAAGGVEVTGGSYARVTLASSLAALSGTQSAGSTAASSGTGGRSSNNATLTFPTPTATWGTVTHMETMDASTLGTGNRLWWAPLGAPKTISLGALAPRFDANTLGFTLA